MSPHVLVKQNVGIDRQKALDVQTQLRALGPEAAEEPRVDAFLDLVTQVLEWPADLIAGAPDGPELPGDLTVALPEYEDRLAPDYALVAPATESSSAPSAASASRPSASAAASSAAWRALVCVIPAGADLDKPLPEPRHLWRASPHARLERLLRESGVSIGLLFNHTHLRLVYAPAANPRAISRSGSGTCSKPRAAPMAGALYALLGERRVTDALPDADVCPRCSTKAAAPERRLDGWRSRCWRRCGSCSAASSAPTTDEGHSWRRPSASRRR